jgi:hypothetical protein
LTFEDFYPVHIFSYHIEFEVYQRTWLNLLYVGIIVSIGDNGHRKFIPGNVENGEADSIEANGSFFYDQWGKTGWEPEPEFPAAREVFFGDTFTNAVYMALYEMAVEPGVDRQTSFDINEMTWLPLIHGGFLECFCDGGNTMAGIVHFFNGKADAIMSDTLVDGKLMRKGGADPEGFIGP